MAVLISTREVPAGQRHDAWRDVVCDTLGPLELRIDPATPLSGRIEAGQLGAVGVGKVQTSTPHSVHRTPRLIRRDSPELYRVVLAVSGRPRLVQNDRMAELRAGEFAIYDFTRPYELAYDAGVRLAVFSFPHDALALPADAVAGLTSVPLLPSAGTSALAAPLLRRVAADLDTYSAASAARLSTVVMSLITGAVAEHAGALAAAGEARRETLLLRIDAFIEQRLGDAELSPGSVAAAHHVSVRLLHRLFESRRMTVAAWIRHRRLERCRADLADPALAALPVGAVAARLGLTDPAHFGRLFRRTYGLPPGEYRRTVRG